MWQEAFYTAIETAADLLRGLWPVLGRDGAQRQVDAFMSALRASLEASKAAGTRIQLHLGQ